MPINALLQANELPPFGAITPEAIGSALDVAIAAQDAVIEALVRHRPTAFTETWLPLERAGVAIEALWSAVYHLHAVADTPELRAAYAAGEARLVEADMRKRQNRDLFDVLTALSTSPGFAERPAADQVAVEHALRDFRLSGVALEPEARASYAEMSVELSRLSTEFASAVLDATDAWSELVTDEALLAGISDTDKDMFRAAALAMGREGWLVTLQQPSVNAVLTFAENRELRARVYEAYGTRGSDQGPQAGQFDNSARIARILELRRQAAHLLGFADPVDWSLATKMASDAGEILAFLRDLAKRAKPVAERDLAELRDHAAAELGIETLQPWDIGFTANRLRQARYSVDEQAVRAYFPVQRVLQGWGTLLKRLFGISLIERQDVALWHEDARYFDVADESGAAIAGLYLDLHARTGKRGGAWMAPARPRLSDGDMIGVPVAYMVCNFTPKSEAAPSLLSHTDVLTLLHETGHCLHHLFTRVDRPSIAGTTGFEWDAIELPSQLMEDFAWDRDVLTGMSGHHVTGEPLPQSLFDRLSVARHFQSGMFIVRQVELSMFDILLHLGTMGSDPMEVIEAVREEVAVVRPPAWHRFPHAFTHIFAGSYAAGYYSYLWAEILAADGFQRFAEAGLVDRSTGELFRDEVLSRGASRPAADSFRAFRGRDPDNSAILKRHGLIVEHR
ncbi:oligopeptidase A [Sphingobium sp. 22B]|uniref:M3 family metallopeptidase n=1 Tax=unclassified Sphingobium TaxID=2611147 RepID=UPI000780D45A|nr:MULTISPECIES: M3 family metallopeptidase [unclassified Sphingobium]KXU31620.1 oligopeptidase A [Sphingobium sp. AM]KYC32953.1 oligopeptidase A [Sphingobium sp. 22B]OAP30567.1 oligopeptidase A [Sphingobium sp. 20006FA]